jgi:hypothetical protein
MKKSEDLLQEALERLEAGEASQVSPQSELDENNALLSLATRLRRGEWPQRDPKVVDDQRERVVKYSVKESQMDAQNKTLFDLFKDWRLPLAISAAVITLFVCGLIATVGFGAIFMNQHKEVVSEQPDSIDTHEKEDIARATEAVKEREQAAIAVPEQEAVEKPEQILSVTDTLSPNEALLGDLHGLVEIEHDDQWRIVQDGTTITKKTRLRTAAFSSASLTFKDGSVAQIGSDSKIVIHRLVVDPDAGVREIVMKQFYGESAHSVASWEAGKNLYQVNSPSSSGKARGTHFHLRVADGQTAWYVDEGEVEVSGKGAAVLVAAGSMTTVGQDQEPEDPARFIVGQGEVVSIGENWIIGDQIYQTHKLTVIVGNPQVRDIVFFEGHMLDDETQVLDLIVLIRRNPANTFQITGEVTDIGETLWEVNGQVIAVTGLTEVDDEIIVGSLVRVTGIILEGGSLQAEEIRLLEEHPGTPFEFIGVVVSTVDPYWSISGVSIKVDEDTEIDDDLIGGEIVQVQGWILEDNTWLATSITRFLDENSAFEFVGRIDSMDPDPWEVAGIPIEVHAWTEKDDDLEVGELVRVEGYIQPGGTWVAYEIKRYDEALLTILIGRVLSMDPDPWIVSGVELNVIIGETIIEGEITLGMLVRVELQLLPDGSHKVIRIEPLKGFEWAEGCHYIVAKVISLDGDQIWLEGWPALPFGEEIEIEGEIKPGSIVQVMICYDEDMNVVVVYIIAIYQPPLPPVGGEGDGKKVKVCHKPNGKNPHTIMISPSALPAHLGHGDYIGPCLPKP